MAIYCISPSKIILKEISQIQLSAVWYIFLNRKKMIVVHFSLRAFCSLTLWANLHAPCQSVRGSLSLRRWGSGVTESWQHLWDSHRDSMCGEIREDRERMVVQLKQSRWWPAWDSSLSMAWVGTGTGRLEWLRLVICASDPSAHRVLCLSALPLFRLYLWNGTRSSGGCCETTSVESGPPLWFHARFHSGDSRVHGNTVSPAKHVILLTAHSLCSHSGVRGRAWVKRISPRQTHAVTLPLESKEGVRKWMLTKNAIVPFFFKNKVSVTISLLICRAMSHFAVLRLLSLVAKKALDWVIMLSV